MGVVNFLLTARSDLVEGRRAARIAAGVAEGAEHVAGSILDRRQNERAEVDVVDVAGVGCADWIASLGHFLAGDIVGAVLVGAAVGRGDLGRDCPALRLDCK